MWDNARLLNALADALLLGAAALLVWHGAHGVLRGAALPLRTIVLTGDAQHADAYGVATQLEGRIAGNFFGVELREVQHQIEALPWVRRATVRRAWPDRLIVAIEEHRPLAQWSDGRQVNTHGELFDAEGDPALPRLGGPPGTEREVALRYLAFRDAFAPLGAAPDRVTLSARLAWQVHLTNGIELQLGRDDDREPLEARVARFVAAFPRVRAQLNRRLQYIDLRYPNGFAIRVPELPPERAESDAPRKRT